MREDSPVLKALKGVTVKCRCGCGKTESPLNMRWNKWGQHGYVTNACWQKANKEYNNSTKQSYPQFLNDYYNDYSECHNSDSRNNTLRRKVK